MKTLQIVAVLLLSASLAFAAKGVTKAEAKSAAESLEGKPAPEFSLSDLQGNTANLAGEKGKIVVLAFWGTWCPPCRAEMPTFAKLQKELASEGVAIVPIAVDTAENARSFLAKKGIDIVSLIDERKEGRYSVFPRYGAPALPKTFVVNREGIVVKALVGKASEAELLDAIHAAQR